MKNRKKKDLFGGMPKLPKLHLAASTDEFRQNLQCIYIDGRIATATNAEVLIRYFIDNILSEQQLLALHGKLIPAEIWKDMCSVPASWITIDGNTITIDDKSKCDVYFSNIKRTYNIESVQEYIYPKLKDILNNVLDGTIRESLPAISINTGNLSIIEKVLRVSIYSKPVLIFNGKNKAIVVTYIEQDNGIAILMPCMFEDKEISTKRTKPFSEFE